MPDDTEQVRASVVARYGRLALIARGLVEGFLTGAHKSPYKGYSVEFAEHRQYYPGDEIRHIDWRAFGKTDRYYIKEYEEETNLRAHLLVDASGIDQSSMQPTEEGQRRMTVTKTVCSYADTWCRLLGQDVERAWLETLQGQTAPTQLQYSQTVLLNFNTLSWPHITVGTLRKA